MTVFPLGESLSKEQLALAASLPLKPASVVLEGRFVRLEPFDLTRDLEALYAVSNGQPVTVGERSVGAYDADALIWRYMFKGPFESGFGAW